MTTTAVSPKTFICCPPPAGTPNPNLPPDFESHTPRPRLPLFPKQELGLFSAADKIRLIIGNHPSVTTHPIKKNEPLVSQTRNNYDQTELEFLQKKILVRRMEAECKQQITKEIASQKIAQSNPKVSSLLQAFVHQNQFANLGEFIKDEYLHRIIEASRHFLQNFARMPGMDPHLISIINTGLVNLLHDHSLETVAFLSKIMIINCIFINMFGLKKSNWHPDHPLSSLIKEIDTNGPILVNGQFGKMLYVEEPFRLSEKMKATVRGKVQERSLWGWRPDSTRKPQNNHTIIIVGARDEVVGTKKTEHIYFIDPLDPSDPDNPDETQKFYVMSLKRLREEITNLNWMKRQNSETGQCRFSEPAAEGQPNEYALHGDPSVNYL